MHVVFRESHGLEETDTPTDPIAYGYALMP